jgi:ParB family chromosome partitioning protein
VPADQVVAMPNQNDEAQRVPLLATERAAGYAQLVAFDLTQAGIGRRTGHRSTEVRAALRLHTMSDTARHAADTGNLSLTDVEALSEFDDDPKAIERILKDAGTSWGSGTGSPTNAASAPTGPGSPSCTPN